MKKIEPRKEQPERIPAEKIEIVFHQGKRLGSCFGEHSFDFSPGDPPSHFNCYSRDFLRQEVFNKDAEDLARKMAEDLDEKILRECFRGIDPNNPLK